MIILVLLFLTTINTKTAQVPRGYVSNFTSPYPDPDFPGWTPSIESLSSCSYIIPMDFAYQGCDNPDEPEVGRINSACDICPFNASYTCAVFTNPDFNLFAYGLVNHLLWSDIPVKWIIKTNKQHNDYDIVNAQTVIVYPSRLANLSNIEASAKPRNFSGGPFAVESQFTHYADPFIANYTLTVGEVRVFMTSEIINVDVRYTLLTRPYVAVLASSNEQFVLEAVLMSAGFQQGLHWEEMTREEARDTLGNGTCVTIAIEPHFHSCTDQDPTSSYTSNSAAFVSAARAVLNMGSNFYAMCGGINTYEQCDNEDGTSCSFCSELNPDATGCENCQEDNSYPIPCRNGDVFNQKCVNVTVGNTPFGGYRQHSLCQPEEPGYFYGRYNPVLTNRYCPEGFFMTENVANSSYGGFHTPPYYLTQINDHMIFHNMAPDIPFNQWLGDWDYETNSSVRYLSLWNSLVDGIPLNQQTKLRTSTWAHFTIAEENNARDNIVKVGYPYGIYYAAHAKLSQFQGGKGGNIFYLAGHYYAADNREIAQAGYILSNSTEAFGGSACVDAGVANSYGLNGQLMSGPATSLGGGCFNRPGRRMLLNAVMTPSNLTCNPSRTVCSNDTCKTETISLQVDPCKAFGVCGGSGFKRNINIVSSTPGGNGQSCIVVNTSNSSLSVPSATSNNSLSVPSATSNNSLSVPSATSNNSLSVPSATSNNSLSVPSATSNNSLSVPSATSNNPPSVPPATSNNPPSVPPASLSPSLSPSLLPSPSPSPFQTVEVLNIALRELSGYYEDVIVTSSKVVIKSSVIITGTFVVNQSSLVISNGALLEVGDLYIYPQSTMILDTNYNFTIHINHCAFLDGNLVIILHKSQIGKRLPIITSQCINGTFSSVFVNLTDILQCNVITPHLEYPQDSLSVSFDLVNHCNSVQSWIYIIIGIAGILFLIAIIGSAFVTKRIFENRNKRMENLTRLSNQKSNE